MLLSMMSAGSSTVMLYHWLEQQLPCPWCAAWLRASRRPTKRSTFGWHHWRSSRTQQGTWWQNSKCVAVYFIGIVCSIKYEAILYYFRRRYHRISCVYQFTSVFSAVFAINNTFSSLLDDHRRELTVGWPKYQIGTPVNYLHVNFL